MARTVIIVHDLVATAQCLHAPCNQALHRVFCQIGVATINDGTCRRSRQTNLLVEKLEKQQPTVRAQVPALEAGNDSPSADASEDEFLRVALGTLWHRLMILLIDLDTNNNEPLGPSGDLRR